MAILYLDKMFGCAATPPPLFGKCPYILFFSHSAPSWILSLAENLTNFNFYDGATKWHDDCKKTINLAIQLSPTYLSFYCVYDMCGVSPISLDFLKVFPQLEYAVSHTS